MKNNMNLEFTNLVELDITDLTEINGGISTKSIVTGIALTYICPPVGLGYWLGYYMNS
jgi:lactobin A/cerein 7B family class IIb bacteriocin